MFAQFGSDAAEYRYDIAEFQTESCISLI